MMKGAAASLIVSFLVLVSPVEWGGTCEIICMRETAENALYHYRYVLVGRVVDAGWDGAEGLVTVEPVRVWKGSWKGNRNRFRLTTWGGSASCGYSMVKGAYYVVYASEEPQRIGLCDHEPTPLAAGVQVVAALDRARRLPPLVVPEVALLPPQDLVCPPDAVDAMIDRDIRESEVVVVGKIARTSPMARPGGPTRTAGVIRVEQVIDGSSGRTVEVEWNGAGDGDTGIWFLGPRLAGGRREVAGHWGKESEGAIRRRLKRKQILGSDCEVE